MIKYLIKFFKLFFIPFILFFSIYYIIENFNILYLHIKNINIILFSLSLFIIFISIIYQYIIWHWITFKNKCQISFLKSIYSKSLSEFGKYIPGKIWGYGLLFMFYKKENKTIKEIVCCTYLEVIISILSAIIVFIFSFMFLKIKELTQIKFILILLLPLFFIIIHPKILQFFINFILKKIKKEIIIIYIKYIDILLILFFYIILWLLFGLSLFFLFLSIEDISFHLFTYISGAFALSSIIGFMIIILPAGIGIREGIFIFLMKFISPYSLVLFISILFRLIFIFSEFLITILFYILIKRNKT